ncbi:MAG: hypothetical protein BGO43_09735 [Gammaproteobacteria bacterium 39-13]|nr:MAG: hypothetical protein BGO43_09735 [Gammaproteobacteria bacterium 39-13]
MRRLSTNEICSISGADYTSDIMATAGTLYVAGTIMSGVSSVTYAAGAAAVGLVGATNPVGWALGAVTSVLAPALGLSAPILIGMKISQANPELSTILVDKYHSYFG